MKGKFNKIHVLKCINILIALWLLSIEIRKTMFVDSMEFVTGLGIPQDFESFFYNVLKIFIFIVFTLLLDVKKPVLCYIYILLSLLVLILGFSFFGFNYYVKAYVIKEFFTDLFYDRQYRISFVLTIVAILNIYLLIKALFGGRE